MPKQGVRAKFKHSNAVTERESGPEPTTANFRPFDKRDLSELQLRIQDEYKNRGIGGLLSIVSSVNRITGDGNWNNASPSITVPKLFVWSKGEIPLSDLGSWSFPLLKLVVMGYKDDLPFSPVQLNIQDLWDDLSCLAKKAQQAQNLWFHWQSKKSEQEKIQWELKKEELRAYHLILWGYGELQFSPQLVQAINETFEVVLVRD